MKKRIIVISLAVLLCLGLAAPAAATIIPGIVPEITVSFPEIPGLTAKFTEVFDIYYEGNFPDNLEVINLEDNPFGIKGGDRVYYFFFKGFDDSAGPSSTYDGGSVTFSADVHSWFNGDNDEFTDEDWEILFNGRVLKAGEALSSFYTAICKLTAGDNKNVWLFLDFISGEVYDLNEETPEIVMTARMITFLSAGSEPDAGQPTPPTDKPSPPTDKPSPSEESPIDAANKLYKLGLFRGVGINADGTPNFDLDRAPTRAEAITMFVRLLGKENEALAGTWSTPFTDVAAWAKPYVGYAYENGLTNGVSATKFDSNSPATASMYITFVLRALGYSSDSDFAWNAAWELSDVLGFTRGEYNKETLNFMRRDVAVISFNVLSVVDKNTGKALYERLVESGVFTREAAAGVGLAAE